MKLAFIVGGALYLFKRFAILRYLLVFYCGFLLSLLIMYQQLEVTDKCSQSHTSCLQPASF